MWRHESGDAITAAAPQRHFQLIRAPGEPLQEYRFTVSERQRDSIVVTLDPDDFPGGYLDFAIRICLDADAFCGDFNPSS
jgi:hypothetical protein